MDKFIECVFLCLAFWFSLSKGQNIVCDSHGTCECPPDVDCVLDCLGDHACWFTQAICPPAPYTCTLNCIGPHACRNAGILASGQQLQVICEAVSTQDSACWFTTILCTEGSECSLDCREYAGQDACRSTKLLCDDSSTCTEMCEGGECNGVTTTSEVRDTYDVSYSLCPVDGARWNFVPRLCCGKEAFYLECNCISGEFQCFTPLICPELDCGCNSYYDALALDGSRCLAAGDVCFHGEFVCTVNMPTIGCECQEDPQSGDLTYTCATDGEVCDPIEDYLENNGNATPKCNDDRSLTDVHIISMYESECHTGFRVQGNTLIHLEISAQVADRTSLFITSYEGATYNIIGAGKDKVFAIYISGYYDQGVTGAASHTEIVNCGYDCPFNAGGNGYFTLEMIGDGMAFAEYIGATAVGTITADYSLPHYIAVGGTGTSTVDDFDIECTFDDTGTGPLLPDGAITSQTPLDCRGCPIAFQPIYLTGTPCGDAVDVCSYTESMCGGTIETIFCTCEEGMLTCATREDCANGFRCLQDCPPVGDEWDLTTADMTCGGLQLSDVYSQSDCQAQCNDEFGDACCGITYSHEVGQTDCSACTTCANLVTMPGYGFYERYSECPIGSECCDAAGLFAFTGTDCGSVGETEKCNGAGICDSNHNYDCVGGTECCNVDGMFSSSGSACGFGGKVCEQGNCVEVSNERDSCNSDGDCQDNEECVSGFCFELKAEGTNSAISGTQDFLVLVTSLLFMACVY